MAASAYQPASEPWLTGGADELGEQLTGAGEWQVLAGEQVGGQGPHPRAVLGRGGDPGRRVDQNPRNSHRPPSSEGYAKPAPRSRRERTDRQPGGQPGHPGATLGQVATPAERVRHRPEVCAGCGAALAEASVVSTEHRQVFDLPEIALRVVEHALEHRRCGCGRVTMADPPAGVTAPAQYGPGVRALATYLLAGQHLPLARTGELLAELIGAPVSQGSLAGWYADAAAALEPVLDVVTTGLAGAEVIGATSSTASDSSFMT